MKATEPARASAAVADAPTGRIADQTALSAVEVLVGLGSERGGLSSVESAARLATMGPNAVRTHKAQAWVVLGFWNEFRAARAPEAEVRLQADRFFLLRGRPAPRRSSALAWAGSPHHPPGSPLQGGGAEFAAGTADRAAASAPSLPASRFVTMMIL